MTIVTVIAGWAHRARRALHRRGSRGQATAEYALVVIAAATIGLLVLNWAADTGGIGVLMDKVLESVISRVS